MSTIIKMRCIDQVLIFESTPVVASGGLEEDVLQVSFCTKWDGMAKTAVFWRTEDNVFHVVLDDEDSCVIPREVLVDEGVLYFGLFGVSADGRQRTSEVARYNVIKGAITEGTKPSDPTPDIYTQLLANYATLLDGVDEIAQAAETSRRAAEAAAADAEQVRQNAVETIAQTAAEAEAAMGAVVADSEASRQAAEAAAADAAKSAAHKHTAEDVGARPDDWLPTAAEVGAVAKDGSIPMSSNLIFEGTASGSGVGPVTKKPVGGVAVETRSKIDTNGGDLVGYAHDVFKDGAWKSRLLIADEMMAFWTDASRKYNELLHSGNFGTYAAPAGYGLGSAWGKSLTDNDANSAVHNGWYRASDPGTAKNFPMYGSERYGTIFVSRRGVYIMQELMFLDVRFTRYSSDEGATWSEWNFVNPSMTLGKEYCTTERIGGKAVYKRNNNGVIEYRLNGETTWKPYATAGGGALMEVVSYVGTGTYGSPDNACSVTFSFAPKLVLQLYSSDGYIGPRGDNNPCHFAMQADALTTEYRDNRGFGIYGVISSNFYGAYGKKSADGKTFSWYQDSDREGWDASGVQCNSAGKTYYVIGIG